MASTLLYGHRLDCILKMFLLLLHKRVWRWKYSSKLKCSSVSTTCIGVNKGFKLNRNRNQEWWSMFHFMVDKESQPYFYFIYILKFKLRWKLWLMIEVSLLLRLLSPVHCCGCMHILGMFQFFLCVLFCACNMTLQNSHYWCLQWNSVEQYWTNWSHSCVEKSRKSEFYGIDISGLLFRKLKY